MSYPKGIEDFANTYEFKIEADHCWWVLTKEIYLKGDTLLIIVENNLPGLLRWDVGRSEYTKSWQPKLIVTEQNVHPTVAQLREAYRNKYSDDKDFLLRATKEEIAIMALSDSKLIRELAELMQGELGKKGAV